MKILNEAKEGGGTGSVFVLIMTKQEAQTLVVIAKAAYEANKRKTTFRRWWKKIEECLECY